MIEVPLTTFTRWAKPENYHIIEGFHELSRQEKVTIITDDCYGIILNFISDKDELAFKLKYSDLIT